MSALGELIRSIRLASAHTDLSTFAPRAKLSVEGLRQYELGNSIPTRKTLERILETGRAPKSIVEKAIRERDLTKAKMEGISLAQLVPPEKAKELVDRLVKMFERFLVDIDVNTSLEERRKLRSMVMNVVKEEVSG